MMISSCFPFACPFFCFGHCFLLCYDASCRPLQPKKVQEWNEDLMTSNPDLDGLLLDQEIAKELHSLVEELNRCYSSSRGLYFTYQYQSKQPVEIEEGNTVFFDRFLIEIHEKGERELREGRDYSNCCCSSSSLPSPSSSLFVSSSPTASKKNFSRVHPLLGNCSTDNTDTAPVTPQFLSPASSPPQPQLRMKSIPVSVPVPLLLSGSVVVVPLTE
jgi:hypothetical protein